MPRLRSVAAAAALASAAVLLSACPAVHKRTRDVDRTPVVHTGAGATIIMPGGGGPAMPTGHPRYGGGRYGAPGAPTGQAPPLPGYPGAPPTPPQPYGGSAYGNPAYGGTPYGGAGTVTQHPHGGSAGGYGAARPGVPPHGPGAGYGVPPQSAPESGRYASSGPPSGGQHVTMIGGSEIEETRHLEVDEEPAYFKYIAAPFVAIGAPFKWAADKIRGEPEAGPAIPRLDTQPRAAAPPSGYDRGAPPPSVPGAPPGHAPPPPQARVRSAPAPSDYETAMLRNMEAELARRQGSAPPRASQPVPTDPSGGSSFAAELAALQRRAGSAEPSGGSASRRSDRAAPNGRAENRPSPHATAGRAGTPSDPVADGIVDRDGDGRVDHWIYREDGRVARESFDDDFDGRPDRSLVYDADTDQVIRIEEDTDRDGGTDTWTSLQDGRVARKRLDANGDGQVDTWTFFRDGEITRLERDTNGDGFRDRIAHYANGALEREEEDRNGDGSPDKITRYDAQARPEQVEEDKDRDGRIDVVSHYEGGRLKRRELLEASALGPDAAGAAEPRL